MSWQLTDAGRRALAGKLSAPQRRVLEDIRDSGNPEARTYGMSMHGGLIAVLHVVRRNKWAIEVDEGET
jgi:hypothetical protein